MARHAGINERRAAVSANCGWRNGYFRLNGRRIFVALHPDGQTTLPSAIKSPLSG